MGDTSAGSMPPITASSSGNYIYAHRARPSDGTPKEGWIQDVMNQREISRMLGTRIVQGNTELAEIKRARTNLLGGHYFVSIDAIRAFDGTRETWFDAASGDVLDEEAMQKRWLDWTLKGEMRDG